MEQIAYPWLVLDLTNNNAAHVGGMMAARVLPQLFFGLWAGVIADWFDRKMLLFGTKFAVLLLQITFATILVTGNIELWHVYALSFIRGTFTAFDQPARQSLVADSVPSELLTNAVALMSATQNFMRIFGVMASGLLIALLGINGTFTTMAVVYLVTVIATWLIDVPSKNRTHEDTTITSDLAEGLRFAWSSAPIRGVILLSLVFYGFAMMWMQLFAALIARTVLDIGALGFSALVSAGGIGALIGSLTLAAKPSHTPGRRIATSVTMMGISLMLFGAAPSLPDPFGLAITFVTIFAVGIFHGVYLPLSYTIVLTAAPDDFRGRVVSIISLDRGMTTVGAIGGGLLAANLGVQNTQLLYGGLTFLGGFAIIALAQGMRDYRIR